MSFGKMRCRHGLRREDVFVLLMALLEANEAAAGKRPPLDLAVLLEPRPARTPFPRTGRTPVGGERPAEGPTSVAGASRHVRSTADPSAPALGFADPGTSDR